MVVEAPGVDGATRVGLAVGRAVGGAVERNRAKRRLREAVRIARVRPGRDYVLIATPEVRRAPFRDLVAWIEQAAGEERG